MAVLSKFELDSKGAFTAAFLGFFSGLPLLLLLSVASVWLKVAGVDLSVITFISWLSVSYCLKFTWAPVVDSGNLSLMKMSNRKSWMLVAMISTALTIGLAGLVDPSNGNASLTIFFITIGLACFSSAVLDTCIDGYRVSAFPATDQVEVSAIFTAFYRVALLLTGALSLAVISYLSERDGADYNPRHWQSCFHIVGLIMAAGSLLIPLLVSRRPSETRVFGDSRGQYWKFFEELKTRFNRGELLILLIFLTTFRIMDILQGGIVSLFLLDSGYTLSDVSLYNQAFGIIVAIIGAFLGGIFVRRLGLFGVCVLSVVLCSLSNSVFIVLGLTGRNLPLLVSIVGLESFSSGLASTAFLIFLSNATATKYSAGQFALFTSLMAILPRVLGGFSGAWVVSFGYDSFFVLTAITGFLALPPLLAMRSLENMAGYFVKN